MIYFGDYELLEKVPQGYKKGFTYGENPFYLGIAYHPLFMNMGVVLKFSASAWKEFQNRWSIKYEKDILISDVLEDLNSKNYSVRLSRIDFTADYFNYPMTVNTLYEEMNGPNPQAVLVDSRMRESISKRSAIITDGRINTFYLGSRKANVDSFMRVYNKKDEQLNSFGKYYNIAIDSDSWIRFEVVFRGKYAHQLTDMVKSCKDSKQLSSLISDKITEKFQFWNIDKTKPLDITNDLLELVNQKFPKLSKISPRDNDLARSVSYLRNGSGLYPVFYKIEQLWGYDSLEKFFIKIEQDYLQGYSPNEDTLMWLKKHANQMKNVSVEDLFLVQYKKEDD